MQLMGHTFVRKTVGPFHNFFVVSHTIWLIHYQDSVHQEMIENVELTDTLKASRLFNIVPFLFIILMRLYYFLNIFDANLTIPNIP